MKKNKKLRLRRETLIRLNEGQAQRAWGGAIGVPVLESDPCYISENPSHCHITCLLDGCEAVVGVFTGGGELNKS